MTRIRDIFLTVAAAVIILQALAATSIAQSTVAAVQQVLVTNTTAQPVPVKAVGTTVVRVVHSARAPLWVRDVNEARQPFASSFGISISPGNQTDTASLPAVPAGKRLVIQHITLSLRLATGQRPLQVIVATTLNGQPRAHYLPMTYMGLETDRDVVFALSEPVAFYVDSGTQVLIDVRRSGTEDTAGGGGSVSGYLVDVP